MPGEALISLAEANRAFEAMLTIAERFDLHHPDVCSGCDWYNVATATINLLKSGELKTERWLSGRKQRFAKPS
jgi:hypothetical protein